MYFPQSEWHVPAGALPLNHTVYIPFSSFSAMSKRCQNLLLQIYLHFPEVIQHVTLPEGTFSSGGAAYGSSCKVKMSRLID